MGWVTRQDDNGDNMTTARPQFAIIVVRLHTFFAEPKQRHEVKWHMMTITITIGMRPLFSPISHPISQIVRQTQ